VLIEPAAMVAHILRRPGRRGEVPTPRRAACDDEVLSPQTRLNP
jgi:hypothetical protein